VNNPGYRPQATHPPVTDQARAKAAFYKQAIRQVLVKGWPSLPTAQKWQIGVGGGVALLSLLRALMGGHMWGPLLGLGGLGVAAHGAWPAIGPHLPQLLQTRAGPTPPATPKAPMAITTAPAGGPSAMPAGGPAHSGGLSPQEAARHPSLSRFFFPDGTPRFHDVVGAPDAEPSQAATLLSPEAKGQLQQRLHAFTPNLAQSFGARALGIDSAGQRKRMIVPLNPGGATPGAVKAGASRYREAAMPPTIRGEPRRRDRVPPAGLVAPGREWQGTPENSFNGGPAAPALSARPAATFPQEGARLQVRRFLWLFGRVWTEVVLLPLKAVCQTRSTQEEVSYRSPCRLPWTRMDSSVAVVKLVDQNGPQRG
jgi:hypothetical protein